MAANQKRKRGRPTNASRDDEPKDAPNSSTTLPQENQPKTNGEIDGDAIGESSRPRKRGRRAKDEPQPESTQTQRTRQRRRQTSAAQMEDVPEEEAGEHVPSEAIKAKKRGRPKRGDQQTKTPELEAEEADDENENEGDSSLLRRSKRNRRSIDASPTSSDNHTAQRPEIKSLANKQAARRRKRPIQLGDNEQPNEEAGPEAEAETTSRAQKKRKKRSRPSQNSQPSVEEAELEPEPVLPRRKRSRATQSGSNGRREEPADEEPQAESQLNRSSGGHRKSKNRRQTSDRQDQSPAHSSSPESASSPPPYRHIAKRTRRVTHEVIESKWSSLEPSSLVNIAALFHSVSQPTLLHVAPKQYVHAEEVLEKVIRGLYKRSGKLPFPPASTLPRREDELDFERTQSAIEVLLSQLDPLQHSVELLRREKERAERELEREYKVLNQLSTNARAEARERRDRLRKVHVLVPEKTSSPATGSIDLLPADKGAGKVFSDVRDEELLGVARQINNHMQSMRGNLYQIDGVLPAIAKSHALLRTTLQPHFGRKQFENIMLGQIEQ
ncbi:hypothetical protein HD806DRAFT_347399 [Xylariaceae sp. AK1471]|nr:hypothetical protein HD806DRAFT_347399 [Xylariaceae sp. AK1471]